MAAPAAAPAGCGGGCGGVECARRRFFFLQQPHLRDARLYTDGDSRRLDEEGADGGEDHGAGQDEGDALAPKVEHVLVEQAQPERDAEGARHAGAPPRAPEARQYSTSEAARVRAGGRRRGARPPSPPPPPPPPPSPPPRSPRSRRSPPRRCRRRR